MAVNDAYRLCLALLKQDSSGSVYSKLTDSEHSSLKWNLTSVIPAEYEFTNFQIGDVSIETIEKNTIAALTKAKKFESGAITPPTMTFASMTPADCASVVSTLDALTGVDDPFKVLFLAGRFSSESGSVRSYSVFNACVGILTSDGGRSAEAKGIFTGSLGIQACHIPIIGATECGATLSWNTSTGVVTASFTSGSGSGSGSGS